eukprot:2868419-Amphidinium_carterae.2
MSESGIWSVELWPVRRSCFFAQHFLLVMVGGGGTNALTALLLKSLVQDLKFRLALAASDDQLSFGEWVGKENF